MAYSTGLKIADIERVWRLLRDGVLGLRIEPDRESAGQASGGRPPALVARGPATVSVFTVTASQEADPWRVTACVWAVGSDGGRHQGGQHLIGVVCAANVPVLLASELVFRVMDRCTRAMQAETGDDVPVHQTAQRAGDQRGPSRGLASRATGHVDQSLAAGLRSTRYRSSR